MSRISAVAFISSLVLPAAGQALEQPDCTRLEPWAKGFTGSKPTVLAPKVVVPGQLTGAKAMQLFGQPVATWSPTDFNAVRRMLNECRRAAHKRHDRATGAQLYKAMHAVGRAMRPVRDMQQLRSRTARVVDNIV
ncbi:MAG: hypothetical protein P8124_06930, partial [Gammaproteobacteria bacterium]